MLQSLGARQPLLNVDTHEGTDEGLRLVADVVPVRRVELELAWKKGRTLVTVKVTPWTKFSLQDEPWAEFSTLEVAACIPCTYCPV